MSTNDITGDKLQTRTPTDAYREGWDRIFGAKSYAEVNRPKPNLEAIARQLKSSDPDAPAAPADSAADGTS